MQRKTIDKVFWSVLLVVGVASSFYWYWRETFDGYSDLITFLSIMIGFKLTFISVLFGSPLRRILHDTKDLQYHTKLHRLSSMVKKSLYFEFGSILALFVVPDAAVLFGLPVGRYLLIGPILWIAGYNFYRLCELFFECFVFPTNP